MNIHNVCFDSGNCLSLFLLEAYSFTWFTGEVSSDCVLDGDEHVPVCKFWDCLLSRCRSIHVINI